MSLEWKEIEEGLQRTPVFNGWLIKTSDNVFRSLHEDMRPDTGHEWRTSITFYPDPNHEWDLEIKYPIKYKVCCECDGTRSSFDINLRPLVCKKCRGAGKIKEDQQQNRKST